MTRRAVYDTMVFFQWAALPADRQHATVKALYDGSIRLCMDQALLAEVRDVLSRPEVRSRAPHLTDDRLRQVLDAIVNRSEWFASVPTVFSWTDHPDDDHLFNLTIAAQAEYLVTWERRIHEFVAGASADAKLLATLAPQIKVAIPKHLAEKLRAAG